MMSDEAQRKVENTSTENERKYESEEDFLEYRASVSGIKARKTKEYKNRKYHVGSQRRDEIDKA